MLPFQGSGGCLSERRTENVLADNSLDVAGVSGNEAVFGDVGRASDPVRRGSAQVAVDHQIAFLLPFVNRTEESRGGVDGFHGLRAVSTVAQNLPLDIAGRGSESVLARRHKAGVTGQIVLVEGNRCLEE